MLVVHMVFLALRRFNGVFNEVIVTDTIPVVDKHFTQFCFTYGRGVGKAILDLHKEFRVTGRLSIGARTPLVDMKDYVLFWYCNRLHLDFVFRLFGIMFFLVLLH
ncbi:hypothetical protein A4A49_35531 [Nicotiana attenuata]|uniref:Uncharacterized protein n=2 Tax=Nicotiana attenuata TaxID=49451 RepID=A0A1J6KBJ8_NICAT|nr:hypothetical protein A4A49_35531 [Nicotiana attenuata]